MDELLLCALQGFVRAAQFLISTFEFRRRPPHQHGADMPTVVIDARRAVRIHRHAGTGRVQQLQLQHLAAALRASLHQHLTHALHAVGIGQQIDQRRAAQSLFAAPHQIVERRIGLLDAALRIAHHQHIRHRRDHAEHELLRLLQLGVLLLQLHLVLDELRIHLVHLLDDVHPHGLVHRALRMLLVIRRYRVLRVEFALLAFS